MGNGMVPDRGPLLHVEAAAVFLVVLGVLAFVLPAVPRLLIGPIGPKVVPVAHQDAAAVGMAHRDCLHAGIVGFLEPDSVSRMPEGLAARFPAIVAYPGESGGLPHGIH